MMSIVKYILKPILKLYLKGITLLVVFVHKPFIIVVAGSMNKHITKEAIAHKLRAKNLPVKVAQRGFNTDIGLPLAILGQPSGYNNIKNWKNIILSAPRAIFKKMEPVLILEFGVSDPGDICYLLSIVRPSVVVFTSINKRHIEAFDNFNELVSEYEVLARAVHINGLVVGNYDNEITRGVLGFSDCKVITYGFSDKAECNIKNISMHNQGQNVIINYNKMFNINILRYGRHHVDSAVVAFIVNKYIDENNRFIKKTTK